MVEQGYVCTMLMVDVVKMLKKINILRTLFVFRNILLEIHGHVYNMKIAYQKFYVIFRIIF